MNTPSDQPLAHADEEVLQNVIREADAFLAEKGFTREDIPAGRIPDDVLVEFEMLLKFFATFATESSF